MLELKNITKVYKTANDQVQALKGVSLKFRESEFVSILGQSGCGKTTLLNIIGGLDRYTSGDLIINGKSTKKFKDRDWDAYRNYKVGFVFQSYNLISHQTVLSNVELALTIGGISKKERKARAMRALEEVGLKEHVHKKPNQLSGGQMQRVAIARALVNDPDIILADEPTGALDTKTSVQVMDILKKISKDKLIIMVTHNADLAEQYSSRIIKILDGLITEDSNPIKEDEVIENKETHKIGRTTMSFLTALRLSLNNLLTKKGRTILVAFAGSIGIIGIALVQSVSNGFQSYVDSIQEEALTSYPLAIMQEASDITSMLLSMRTSDGSEDGNNKISEKQYISKMLGSISKNDLRSLKKYLNNNSDLIKNDISSIMYSYSVEPHIYAVDATEKIVKLNPVQLFTSSFASSTMFSSFTSIYSQMTDDMNTLTKSYDVLAGHWPEKYDEMVLVLSDKNSISDLLVYSLGLRDSKEMTDMISKIMSGESVNVNNEPFEFTYDELLNIKLKLLMPYEKYKYNEKYEVYEDMTEDEEFLKELYDKSEDLKIVGIVTTKDGVTTSALNPGVCYRSDLISHIIEKAKDTEIVKKQLANQDVDVLSGNRFDDEKSNLKIDFADVVSVDEEKLKSAFGPGIDQDALAKQTQDYMSQIANSISTDISGARDDMTEGLETAINGLVDSLDKTISLSDLDGTIEKYEEKAEFTKILSSLETKYGIPKDIFKNIFTGLLKGFVQSYAGSKMAATMPANIGGEVPSQIPQNTTGQIPAQMPSISQMTKEELEASIAKVPVPVDKDDMKKYIDTYFQTAVISQTVEATAVQMTEASMKKNVLTKVGELTANLTQTMASALKVDPEAIAGAFKMNMSEDELKRVVSAMLTKTESTAKMNLVNFGYQDLEEPTYISFYFKSFDGKEHFKEVIEKYNESVKQNGHDDKEINYTDTTGILMDSVKVIVNAVTYVLIAFISISLVVSSFMIGIITYISVYERTKEIGILRAIGASKKNISSIFNAETFIIGFLSGLFGIGITYFLIPIINTVLHEFTGNIPLNAILYPGNAMVLVVLSVILTLIGGLIPAKAASKKDPVIALRTE